MSGREASQGGRDVQATKAASSQKTINNGRTEQKSYPQTNAALAGESPPLCASRFERQCAVFHAHRTARYDNIRYHTIRPVCPAFQQKKNAAHSVTVRVYMRHKSYTGFSFKTVSGDGSYGPCHVSHAVRSFHTNNQYTLTIVHEV